MLYCQHGVVKQHTGARVAHNLAYLSAHIGFVAMYRASGATRFLVSILAMLQTLVRILKEQTALGAKSIGTGRMSIASAIESYHCRYGALLFLYLGHITGMGKQSNT